MSTMARVKLIHKRRDIAPMALRFPPSICLQASANAVQLHTELEAARLVRGRMPASFHASATIAVRSVRTVNSHA
jgi:hypothetical protein